MDPQNGSRRYLGIQLSTRFRFPTNQDADRKAWTRLPRPPAAITRMKSLCSSDIFAGMPRNLTSDTPGDWSSWIVLVTLSTGAAGFAGGGTGPDHNQGVEEQSRHRGKVDEHPHDARHAHAAGPGAVRLRTGRFVGAHRAFSQLLPWSCLLVESSTSNLFASDVARIRAISSQASAHPSPGPPGPRRRASVLRRTGGIPPG